MTKPPIQKLLSTVLVGLLLSACVPARPVAAPAAQPTSAPTIAPTDVPAATEVATVAPTVEATPTEAATDTPVATATTEVSATAATIATTALVTPADAMKIPRLRQLDFAPFEAALTAFTSERAAAVGKIVVDATVPQVQAALAAGDLTSEELTLYFLARIKQYDETLRHYLELNPDALTEAQASDARRKAGKLLGPLDGIPVNLKDNIATAAPMHTTGGAQILLNNVPKADAPLVKNLRDAGAVILGKANLSELAGAIAIIPPGSTAVGGLTMNPYSPQFSTLGSSSGSAASTSAYLTLISVGSETAGSLIAPSSWNGVVGLYPSRGVVDGTGVIPLLSNNDSAGPIGRSVTDVAVLLGVIDTKDIDYAAGLDAKALDGVKAGLLKADILAAPSNPFEDTTDNPAIVNRIETSLTGVGAVITDVTLTGIAENNQINRLLGAVLNGGIRNDMLPYLTALGAPVKTAEDLAAYNQADPKVRIPFGEIQLDITVKDTQLSDPVAFQSVISEVRAGAIESLETAFASNDVDVLVSLNNYHSALYATANYPAISIPFGLRKDGQPVGVTLIGRPGGEAKLLAYAFAFEQQTKARVNPDVSKTVAEAKALAEASTPASAAPATPYGAAWQSVSCDTLKVAPAIGEVADCGYVTVPEKRGESGLALGDKTIQLGVVRVKSTSKTPGAPVVVGTGGPGGGGFLLVLASTYAGGTNFLALYKNMLADRDVVFFTQRGTRGAKPELNCTEFDAVSYEAAVKGWSQAEKEAQYTATTQACADASVAQGIDLSAYNTQENAADIFDIRQAMGYDKIIYYGQSYGTLLGQFLMRNHPEILEAVILDGIVPADIPTYAQVINVPAAFRRVFAACEADAYCNGTYPNLEATLTDVMARLKANPVPVEVAQTDGTTVTVKVDHLAVMGGLFIKIYLGGADVPSTIYALKDNDLATIAAMAPSPDGGTAKLMHFTVNCSDDPNASIDEFKLAEVPEAYADYVEDDGIQQVLACQVLKVPQLPDSSDAPVKSDLPVLLLNGGMDPATAAELSRRMVPDLPNSQYVLFPTRGHVQSQFACGISIMTAFSKRPLDKVDTTCIPPKPIFAFDATATNEAGTVSITLKLGAAFVSAGLPGLWQGGKSVVGLNVYSTTTSVEDALSTTLKVLSLPFDATKLEDGPVILGEPSKVIRGSAVLAGFDYAYDYYVIKHPAGTLVISFLQGEALRKATWREKTVPEYLKALVLSQLPLAASGVAAPAAFSSAWTSEPCETFKLRKDIAESSDCGYVTVPELHESPDGATLKLAVVRIRSVGENPVADPLVMEQGGPGGSTLAYFPSQIRKLIEILKTRDIVLVEQRGTQYSQPVLDCPEKAAFNIAEAKDPTVDYSSYLPVCKYRWETQANLNAFNDTQNAADMYFVVDALGYKRFNYYGLSYGTLLGQYVMNQSAAHPGMLRSVILDSVEPIDVEDDLIKDQTASNALRNMFTACAADAVCNRDFPNLETRTLALLDEMNANPIVITPTLPGGEKLTMTLSGTDFFTMLFGAMYVRQNIAILPGILDSMIQKQDYTWATIQKSEGFGSVGGMAEGMHLTMKCPRMGQVPPLTKELFEPAYPQAKIVAEAKDDYARRCAILDVASAGPNEFSYPTEDIPTLILNGNLDPTTPPAFGERVGSKLKTAYVFTMPDAAHSVMLGSPTVCPVNIAAAFLNDPTQTPDSSCIAALKPIFAARVTPLDELTFETRTVLPGVTARVPTQFVDPLGTGLLSDPTDPINAPTGLIQFTLTETTSLDEALSNMKDAVVIADEQEIGAYRWKIVESATMAPGLLFRGAAALLPDGKRVIKVTVGGNALRAEAIIAALMEPVLSSITVKD